MLTFASIGRGAGTSKIRCCVAMCRFYLDRVCRQNDLARRTQFQKLDAHLPPGRDARQPHRPSDVCGSGLDQDALVDEALPAASCGLYPSSPAKGPTSAPEETVPK